MAPLPKEISDLMGNSSMKPEEAAGLMVIGAAIAMVGAPIVWLARRYKMVRR